MPLLSEKAVGGITSCCKLGIHASTSIRCAWKSRPSELWKSILVYQNLAFENFTLRQTSKWWRCSRRIWKRLQTPIAICGSPARYNEVDMFGRMWCRRVPSLTFIYHTKLRFQLLQPKRCERACVLIRWRALHWCTHFKIDDLNLSAHVVCWRKAIVKNLKKKVLLTEKHVRKTLTPPILHILHHLILKWA